MPDVELRKLGRQLPISIDCVFDASLVPQTRLRDPKTITAMAHRLARLVYRGMPHPVDVVLTIRIRVEATSQAPNGKKEAGQVFLPPFFPVTGNSG